MREHQIEAIVRQVFRERFWQAMEEAQREKPVDSVQKSRQLKPQSDKCDSRRQQRRR
jgi:hypothetical protein